jgi:8-amino-7-oxononanoate synthase
MRRGDPLERRIGRRLRQWRDAGLERTLRPPDGVDLSSNDYLSLARHPRLIEALRAGAVRDGVGSTASRLLRGQRDAFLHVEQRFARFKGAERALYFSSGYLANIAVMGTCAEAGDVIFSDALNHASLVDGMRLSRARCVVVPHNDIAALGDALEREPCDGVRFVVVESLFSMEGDAPPLGEIASLCRAAGAALIVDEAHAVGVYGEHGSGLIEGHGIADAVALSINSAGKALGVAGAFVAGSSDAVEYLIQRARPFIFSTAPPPALADAIGQSLDIVRDEPERRRTVSARAAFLRGRLEEQGVPTGPGSSQIVSIPIGDNRRAVTVAGLLAAGGFDVRAIRPPSVPDGTARLRVSVNAGLSEDVLARFACAVSAALERAGACSEVSS